MNIKNQPAVPVQHLWNLHVLELMENPRMMPLLRFLFQPDDRLPEHRPAFYRFAVARLLSIWSEDDALPANTGISDTEAKRLLAELAWWLQTEHPASESITEGELAARLCTIHAEEGSSRFLDFAASRPGMLLKSSDGRWSFCDQTFQAWFAALRAASNESPWDSIRMHLHDPKWRDVIAFTAAHLSDPSSGAAKASARASAFVKSIAKAGSELESLLHRDLRMAVRALIECDPAGVEQRLTDGLYSELLAVWRSVPSRAACYSVPDTFSEGFGSPLTHRFARQVAELFEQRKRVPGPKSRRWDWGRIMSRVTRQNTGAPEELTPPFDIALSACYKMGFAAATPELLRALLDCLVDDDRDVRNDAGAFVGKLRGTAVRPGVLSDWLRLLRHENEYIRGGAIEIVGRLGAAASIRELVETLTESLRNGSPIVRATAARALACIGGDARTAEVLASVADGLNDKEASVRRETVYEMGKFGELAASIANLDRIAVCLADKEYGVMNCAANAVAELGHLAATPTIEARLSDLVADEVDTTRQTAIRALGAIGTAAKSPRVFDQLMAALNDESEWVRAEAVKALAGTPAVETIPGIAAFVARCVEDNTVTMVADVLKQLGSMGILSEVLDRWVNLLSSPDTQLRIRAAKAIGMVGPAAATPKVVMALLNRLNEEPPAVGLEAVEAVCTFGASAARPEVMERLVGAFRFPHDGMRVQAARVIVDLSLAQAKTRGPDFAPVFPVDVRLIIDELLRLAQQDASWIGPEADRALGHLTPFLPADRLQVVKNHWVRSVPSEEALVDGDFIATVGRYAWLQLHQILQPRRGFRR